MALAALNTVQGLRKEIIKLSQVAQDSLKKEYARMRKQHILVKKV